MDEIKVGDRVECVDTCCSSVENGDMGTVVGISCATCDVYEVKFDYGAHVIWSSDRFKLIPKLTTGSKVLWHDLSYSMEFVDGKIVEYYGGNYKFNEVYEITQCDMELPTAKGSSKLNDTIIRGISDGRIFFTQLRFLKEYVVKPKFKRGDFVIFTDIYCRVRDVVFEDNKYSYLITQIDMVYRKNENGFIASENELKEATP